MAKITNKSAGTQGGGQQGGGGGMEEAGGGLDLPDVFCALGSLIVEGRLPTGGKGQGQEGRDGGGEEGRLNGSQRGCGEGPHVELPGKISRHKCSQDEYLCTKNENFRKHMLLLWQNNVPMSIEVLMCSNCRVGQAKARSLEVTTLPEPGSILLEQWTVSVKSCSEGTGGQMSSLALLQAVRSYLHFSQLSAWYSSSGGNHPWNILIRVTIPGEEFASKFTTPPEKHYFPTAGVGTNSTVSVSVRSLPRAEEIPRVVCSHNQHEEEESSKLGIAGALAWREPSDSLRRSLVKSRLAASETVPLSDRPGCLSKSDSMDSMLGDSLLDPPQSLARMTPRRYQSPSRCGSPSLEAPEPLMGARATFPSNDSGGRVTLPSYEQAVTRGTESQSPNSRLNRHDLMRRRDLTLFHDLHPRLLQGHQRLSLPPRTAGSDQRQPLNPTPCRSMGCDSPLTSNGHILSDQLPIPCNISGKHICQFEEELEEPHQKISPSSPPESCNTLNKETPSCSDAKSEDIFYPQVELGAKQKGWTSRLERTNTPYSRNSSSDSSQPDQDIHTQGSGYRPCKDADYSPLATLDTDWTPGQELDLSKSEMDSVLSDLRARGSPLCTSKERRPSLASEETSEHYPLCSKSSSPSSLEELLQDPQQNPSLKQLGCGGTRVTQLYRAEVQRTSSPSPINSRDIFPGVILNSHKEKEGKSTQPVIHSLRETSSKYSSQTSSSSDSSPLSPPYTLLEEQDHLPPVLHSPDSHFYHKPGPNIFPPKPPKEWWLTKENRSPSPAAPILDFTVGELCDHLEKKCLISKKTGQAADKENQEPVPSLIPSRERCYSETTKKSPGLNSLDISFDDYEDSWSLTAERVERLNKSDLQISEKRRISTEEEHDAIPSFNKKHAFRKSLNSATSMVFHSRTGLPLTSSPAPMRRGVKFDFDSGISNPKDIKRALFESQSPEESECGSPKKKKKDPRKLLSSSAPATVSGNNLLGNFEESVLNGRLEPVSTVEGFTAEIGASGAFHPKHLTFPVTVFFYTLCENSTVASPYLGHINLGKKGYRVPEKGTLQLTLFNPMGTVVKMFVVMYDLTDMPPNSQTFLRQRTLYMPSDQGDSHPDAQKWLRYLIHLRLASSKSGKIYLHTDVRMIIFRKSDLDTATDHEAGKGFELRSFTRGPSNPKFSPRK